MKYVKKIIGLKIIIIIYCLAVTTSVNASGFVFNWQPFVVDADLSLKSPNKEILIKKSVTDISTFIGEESRDVFSSSTGQNNVSAPKSEKKSMSENIKISVFQTDTFITDRHEIYSHSDDEQISKLATSLTSLIYDDSKIKSLETIGKRIEPQINFYFKF